jgi:glycerol-3-phosphate dehydrogenase
MASHLGWSLSRKKQEIRGTVKFLESMGLRHEVVEAQYQNVGGLPEPIPRGWYETLVVETERNIHVVISSIFTGFGFFSHSSKHDVSFHNPMYSPAKFEKGELAALRNAFESFATEVSPSLNAESTTLPGKLLPLSLVPQVLKQVPAYQGNLEKDLAYVLVEAGFKGRQEVGFDEFIEVRVFDLLLSKSRTNKLFSQICGDLKEVAFAPPFASGKKQRKAIPVEKSGGGV